MIYIPPRFNDDGTLNPAYDEFFDYDEQETRAEAKRDAKKDEDDD